MQLKVGELARRTGLTVRTLHHYDAMGLLVPSARTDAGYRLYNRDDIARLHAIQALRQIGMPLAEIASLLDGAGESLPEIIRRQLIAIERQIARAGELRSQLTLLQARLAEGGQPDMAKWLSALELMSTYGKYFTTAETKTIIDNWKRTESMWPPLVAQVRSAMARGIAAENLEIQPLARRWMDLTHLWMGGDLDLIGRWSRMYMQEPMVQGKNGVELEVAIYIHKAIGLRLAALYRYFTKEELSRFNVTLEDEWLALNEEIGKLVHNNIAPKSRQAQACVAKWRELLDRTTNHDPALRDKLLQVFGTDPLLRAGAVMAPASQDYLRRAWKAGSAPPSRAIPAPASAAAD